MARFVGVFLTAVSPIEPHDDSLMDAYYFSAIAKAEESLTIGQN
jgi:hypothetical protein